MDYIPQIDTTKLSNDEIKIWFGLTNKELELIRTLENCKIFNRDKEFDTFIYYNYWVGHFNYLRYRGRTDNFWWNFEPAEKYDNSSNVYKALMMILPKIENNGNR